MHKKVLVEDVIRETLAVLERRGYNVSGTRKYITVYRALAQFSQLNYEGTYSHEVGEAFMQSLRERKEPLSAGFYRAYANAVEHANHVMEGDFTWRPEIKNQNYADSCYRQEMRLYEEYLKNSGKTNSDVRSRMHIVARFLRHLDDTDVKKLTAMGAVHIYEAFQAATDKGGFHKSVGAFLRYAHRHSLTSRDYSVLVPQAKRHIPVPTVYTPEEVEKIIETSVKSKRCGKRNYAIVLIAARLGLRSCDIVNLRFENILTDSGWIKLVQVKTGEHLSLPLLPEVYHALIDYVENERPDYDSDIIFSRAAPPFDAPLLPHTIYSIVSRIIGESGIATKGRKCGAHALRSSLATALLNEGNDYRSIQEALGQKSPNAVKSYVKTDAENLREYALPVPAPRGKFSESLEVGA